MKKRYLVIVLIVLSIVSLFIGVTSINLNHIFDFSSKEFEILFLSRIPRLITVLMAGIGISISGLIMQQISRNKFVSPTTAATMDFAKLGILFAMILFTSATIMEKMIIAFIFALIGTIFFMMIVNKIKIKNIIFIPLLGMMIGKIIGSITTFISYKYDLMQNVSSWMEGDLSMVMKGNYEMLYLIIPTVVVAFLYANKFTIAGLGEDFAVNLGLNYKRVVNIGLMIVALVSALTLVTVGNIPFLGLVVPNIVSLYLGDNLKNSLYHIVLLGPIFLLICDIISRVIIFPFEISIGLTVGVIGSVIFLIMILRRHNYEG